MIARTSSLAAITLAAALIVLPTEASEEARAAHALAAVEDAAPALEQGVDLAPNPQGATVRIAASASDLVDEATVEATEHSLAIGFEGDDGTFEMGISTPVANTTDTTLSVTDGAAVSVSEDLGISQVTEVAVDGVRMTTVISEPATAPIELEYQFEGVVLFEAGDGSVDIAVQGEIGALVFGRIASPWATDADGEDVPTYYTVDEGTIVQHVEVDDDTSYPVVADPHFLWTNGSGNFDIRWSSSETSALARGGLGSAADFATGCASYGWIHPAAYATLWAACFDGHLRFVAVAKIAVSTSGCVRLQGDITPFYVLGPNIYSCKR